jgi:hypothetical protein
MNCSSAEVGHDAHERHGVAGLVVDVVVLQEVGEVLT